ncbi:MAG: GNAT family N-acetyltransferase [Fulvivirga sp.]|uniref:GNAT family N-acetyltransferase n=1 Tax=Fulvivirga sp. TaxID=1931237 RepID=UPI0032EC17C5
MEVKDFVPEGYHYTFEEYVFNTHAHRLTQAQSNWRSFYLLDDNHKTVVASWHVHVKDGLAKSPYRATFGGPDFSENLSIESLNFFVRAVEEAVLSTIEVILPSENLNLQKFTIAKQAFTENGFKEARSQVNATIPITNKPFEQIIHKSEIKKLKRSLQAGLIAKKLGIDDFSQVYNHLKESRTERGYQLSMTEAQLLSVVEKMPTHFHLFGVFDAEKMVASAITIKLSKKALYVFYGGHSKNYDRLSPAVLLHAEIYAFCQKQGMQYLDLGTSSKGEETDHNLLDFKKYIGAETGLKLTFRKS